jgi:hypothetical protein
MADKQQITGSYMYAELKRAWAELTAPGQMFEVHTVDIRGVPTRAYIHAPASLRDVWLAAAGHGDGDYLIYRGRAHQLRGGAPAGCGPGGDPGGHGGGSR